jgi:hypothetical protein
MEATRPLPSISFPETELVIDTRGDKEYVLDPVRRSFVRLTPEEWVRQHALRYLIDYFGAPPGLIAVEKAFMFNGMVRRADILVHRSAGDPLLLVECKSPSTVITQSAFDQVSRYNVEIGARYLMVTNGHLHYCFQVDVERRSWSFLRDLPPFTRL